MTSRMSNLDETLVKLAGELTGDPETKAFYGNVEALQDSIIELCQKAFHRFCGQTKGGPAGQLLPISVNQIGFQNAQASLRRGEVFDLVYVVPESVALWEMLQVLENEVEKVAQAVRTAGGDGMLHSPGLEFTYEGAAVKLLLANDADVSKISPDTVNSRVAGLIARLVSKSILDSVPDLGAFHGLLKCIRLWAKQRGLYGPSHDFGYIGGMGWAICCAHICQANPQSRSLEQLFTSFFMIMSGWDVQMPISIQPHSQAQAFEGEISQGAGYKVVLPVGKGLSATPNLTASAAHQLQKEFRRGNRMCAKIHAGAAEWSDVYASSKFVERYLHFLQIDVTAASDAIMSQWLLWCRRHLQGIAETLESVRTCHLRTRPWPVWVSFKDPDWHVAKTLLIALRISPPISASSQAGAKPVVDLREVLVTVFEKLCAWPYATKHLGEFDLYIRHMSQPEVMSWLSSAELDLPVQRQLRVRDEEQWTSL
ncbi:unnamed protein product [Durusdinium trenchii]|uniref:polynucleotide adenylyltransferase n=2 Tax=Durusdinium trenchii TaxID=1381693 RepID=A0ABP0IQQ7_9DINO